MPRRLHILYTAFRNNCRTLVWPNKDDAKGLIYLAMLPIQGLWSPNTMKTVGSSKLESLSAVSATLLTCSRYRKKIC
jgi:hypothetical protein